MNFGTEPRGIKESEMEQASYAYLMTLMFGFVGLPLPIVNLLGTLLYFWLNKTKSPFVRFHQWQAMLSQIPIVAMNSVGLTWTIRIIWGNLEMSNLYLGYIVAAVIFNLTDVIYNIIAASKVRRGHWYSFLVFGLISRYLVFPEDFQPLKENVSA